MSPSLSLSLTLCFSVCLYAEETRKNLDRSRWVAIRAVPICSSGSSVTMIPPIWAYVCLYVGLIELTSNVSATKYLHTPHTHKHIRTHTYTHTRTREQCESVSHYIEMMIIMTMHIREFLYIQQDRRNTTEMKVTATFKFRNSVFEERTDHKSRFLRNRLTF